NELLALACVTETCGRARPWRRRSGSRQFGPAHLAGAWPAAPSGRQLKLSNDPRGCQERRVRRFSLNSFVTWTFLTPVALLPGQTSSPMFSDGIQLGMTFSVYVAVER